MQLIVILITHNSYYKKNTHADLGSFLKHSSTSPAWLCRVFYVPLSPSVPFWEHTSGLTIHVLHKCHCVRSTFCPRLHMLADWHRSLLVSIMSPHSPSPHPPSTPIILVFIEICKTQCKITFAADYYCLLATMYFCKFWHHEFYCPFGVN